METGRQHCSNNRFLLCKHLVNACKPIGNNIEFFSEVRRQRAPPFWVHRQLVLDPDFQKSVLVDSEFEESADYWEKPPEIDPAVLDEDELVNLDDDDSDNEADLDNLDRLCADIEELGIICRREQSIGNRVCRNLCYLV